MTRQSRFFILLMLLATVGLLWPSDAIAQRARPRGGAPPPAGTAVPRTHPPRYYRPYYYPRYYYPYYSPWYYGGYYYPYYSGFGFGLSLGWYGQWGPYGYPYPYPYPHPYPYYYWYDNTGSARVVITPRNAQVYVDGQFVGLVDEFDGSFQRLHVEIGEHVLQVYLEGYRTFTQKVLFTRGTTLRIEHTLEPLPPGEQPEPKPGPVPGSVRPSDPYRPPRSAPPYPAEQAEFGTLSLRVSPSDAEVLVDGEAWDRPEGEDRFSIDLPEGPHRVEVRKEGYRPYVRTIDVRRGRTITLNVGLGQN